MGLERLRVLDLSEGTSGPHCAKLLADYGADVLKIERPRIGDPTRHQGPFLKDTPHPERSGAFLHLNTNKRGITLDLASPRGQSVLRQLVGSYDVLIESSLPGQMAEWG